MPDSLPSTALVVTDMQRYTLEFEPYTQEGQPEGVIKTVQEALSAARASAKMRILHVLHVTAGGYADPAPYVPGWTARGVIAERSHPLVRPEEWVIDLQEPHPATAPVEGEWVFTKPGFDMFKPFGLLPFLAGQGIDRLVLCGVKTHQCIHASARHALSGLFQVSVMADGTASTFADDKENSLRELRSRGVDIITLEQFRAMCVED